jgi:hypothetical protein
LASAKYALELFPNKFMQIILPHKRYTRTAGKFLHPATSDDELQSSAELFPSDPQHLYVEIQSVLMHNDLELTMPAPAVQV